MYCLPRKRWEETGGPFALMITQWKYDESQLWVFNAKRIRSEVGDQQTEWLKALGGYLKELGVQSYN